ncbi:gag protease polyprotein [Cucumis melo var. makuwa]|uniref:Gag protease polyprotein n=1 Tax=Cucumis melo var. makuwa TaxID=1194695 RepID=A0A5D3BUH6_CUCMM|nr:gag protease polyprotein [Cucumis melo var. makuwa]
MDVIEDHHSFDDCVFPWVHHRLACFYEITDCTCLGTCQLRGRGRGKSKGKLANDQNPLSLASETSGKMLPCRGACRWGGRGGRGAGRIQPEEQPAVQATDPTAFVTQADLAAMEKRYQDMLRDALAPFHAAQQASIAPVQTQAALAQTQTAPA